MIREYLNACDAWFISWGMRDSWIICLWMWKISFSWGFSDNNWFKKAQNSPMDSLASMSFPSRSVIRTWSLWHLAQPVLWHWRLRPLRSALVYRCSMENEIEILSSAVTQSTNRLNAPLNGQHITLLTDACIIRYLRTASPSEIFRKCRHCLRRKCLKRIKR